jgi:O-antigen/teichoic acid export membrane protein
MEILSSNNRIAKNSLLLYFRLLLTLVINLYTSRVILKTLGVVDFGIYNVVGGVITMFSFLNAAMANATQRYLTFELGKKDNNRYVDVFNNSILIHFVISILILLLGESVGLWFLNTHMFIPENRMVAANIVYQCATLSSVVVMMSVPYNAVIISHERMSMFAYISILDAVFKLLIVFLLIIIPFDKLKIYAILLLLVQIIIRCIYKISCNKLVPKITFRPNINKPLLKEMVSLASWNLIGSLSFVLNTQGLNILLNIFFGPIVNAARGIAIQVQQAITAFTESFQTALKPPIVKSYAENNMIRMQELIFISSRFSYFLSMLICVPIFINLDFILLLWLGTVPDNTVNFVYIVLLITMVDVTFSPFKTAIFATGNIRNYQLFGGSLLLLVLPITYYLFRVGFPPIYAFISYFVAIIVYHIYRMYIVKIQVGISIRLYLKEVVLNLSTVTIVTVISIFLMNQFCSMKNILIKFVFTSLTSAVITISIIYIFGLKRNEKQALCNQIIKLKNKYKHEKNKY